MEPDRLSQVEDALGRMLTDEELVIVSDLAELQPSHLDVIEQLYKQYPISAVLYLRAVTNGIDRSTLRNYVNGFYSIEAQRNKPAGLRAQPLYERVLGRALTSDEIVSAGSLGAISPAAREVARALAAEEHGIALAYLHDLVQLAAPQEQLVFLETLLRNDEDRPE